MITFITSLVLGIFINNYAIAQESPNTYISPCFPNSAQAQRALRKIEFIKAPVDKIKRDNNCIEILTFKRREELFRSYLSQNFRFYKMRDKNLGVPKTCHLELIKTTYSNLKNQDIKFGSRNKAQLYKEKNKKVSSSQIIVQSGKSASIGASETKRILLLNNLQEVQDNTTLKINCTVVQKGYQIKIDSTDPKNSISTSRFLKFGESIELGALNNSESSDSKDIDLSGLKKVDYQQNGLTTFRLRAKNQRK